MRVAPSLIASLLLMTLGGCSSADPRLGPDCESPFHFQDQEYLLAPGPPHDEPVKPGARLGEGASESCAQYGPGDHTPGDGSDRLTEPRPVYAFPTVPPEQAIVLMSADDHASVLLAVEKPEDGWDPDLRAWLDENPKR